MRDSPEEPGGAGAGSSCASATASAKDWREEEGRCPRGLPPGRDAAAMKVGVSSDAGGVALGATAVLKAATIFVVVAQRWRRGRCGTASCKSELLAPAPLTAPASPRRFLPVRARSLPHSLHAASTCRCHKGREGAARGCLRCCAHGHLHRSGLRRRGRWRGRWCQGRPSAGVCLRIACSDSRCTVSTCAPRWARPPHFLPLRPLRPPRHPHLGSRTRHGCGTRRRAQ